LDAIKRTHGMHRRMMSPFKIKKEERWGFGVS
jgi:hypothetical protein